VSKQGRLVPLVCSYCGVDFLSTATKPSRAGQLRYCSHACSARAQKGRPHGPQEPREAPWSHEEIRRWRLVWGTKQCTECGRLLPQSTDCFHRDPGHKTIDGLKSQCRECLNRLQRERYRAQQMGGDAA
jgi:hypothetical protein